MRKVDFLDPGETYEIYEKRSHSPLNYSRPSSSPIQNYPQQINNNNKQYLPSSSYAFVPIPEKKTKISIWWIIGIATIAPIFIVLMLFLAVWLQEMGII
ncbi:hypothetical protein Mgra_00000081 [Meloidogyne graminicola]|uniref:Uncharacterized protein n=1 Tax=Meloidogyne graminicola TaxID=189291 RepID=A0A8T0A3Z0_9BILA|nr:hypothetical protein Mgra_00000081 [Meloidogyne graminicola]